MLVITRRCIALAALALAGLLLPTALRAQGAPAPGTLAGAVVDADSGRALAGVTVVLEPAAGGALPARTRGGSPFLQATRSAISSDRGEYRFEALPPGTYRLRFARAGYRPATLEVDYRGSSEARVSVGLSVAPVVLEAVTVTSVGPNPFGRASARAPEDARLAAEQLRRERFLAGDVRSLTHADVVEGVTLAETDLFRGLQRLPGVGARDIWSAELWTRGAPWDQTRAYFDGLPLFNPLHAFGAFSGVNPDALGAALFHPGVQPAELGGGAAGTLDLRSRRGGGEGELRGTGELSLVSARLALERQARDAGSAWSVAARRTHLDLLSGAVERLGGGDDVMVPYAFYDASVRADYRLGRASALEISSLVSFDQITGDLPDVLHHTRAHWGGGAGRMTLSTPVAGLETRHTLGLSGFGSRARRVAPDTTIERLYGAPAASPAFNDVWYLSLAGEARPPGGGAVSPWRAGYELALEQVVYRGLAPNPYLVERPEEIARSTPAGGQAQWDERLLRGSVWAERRWQPAERLELETGVRLDAGPALRNAGMLRPAPRLAARWELTPQLSLSAAAGRSYQYEQALASGGIRPHDGFQSDYLWALAGDTVPPIRSDVATLGAEGWLGTRWIASANLYARRSSDVLVPNPAPGTLFDGERASFLTGSTLGHGVELGIRRLVGRWTAGASYTLADTRVRAGGLEFAAPGDRRHELDANFMARLGGSWRLGAAYSASSGLPYTRTLGGEITCSSADPNDHAGTGPRNCMWLQAPLLGEPGAQRGAAYQRLDLLLAWNRTFRSWEIDAFVQLHNALNWSNVGGYTGTSSYCYYNPGHCRLDTIDNFLPGAPILPVMGVRVHF